MADRKRPSGRQSYSSSFSCSSSSASELSDVSKAKRSKHQISVTTFKKWQRNFDQDHQTLMWLNCDKDKNDRFQTNKGKFNKIIAINYL